MSHQGNDELKEKILEDLTEELGQEPDQETLEKVIEERMELLSVCCGAKEHEHAEHFCSACREATGFEQVLSS